MTSEERAQLVEDIERSANTRRGIAEQARLGRDFDIAAAWEEVEQLDASINARVDNERLSHHDGGKALLTAQEFLDISTKLFADMKVWIEEASREGSLSASDLAMLDASMKIVERATLKGAEIKRADQPQSRDSER
jgi:hypothetical protein